MSHEYSLGLAESIDTNPETWDIQASDEFELDPELVHVFDTSEHSHVALVAGLDEFGWDRKYILKTFHGVTPELSSSALKIHIGRLISVACVNFMIHSRKLHDFWVFSHGTINCTNKSWTTFVNFSHPGTKCNTGHQENIPVEVTDYVEHSMTIGDFMLEYPDEAEDSMSIILQILFINLQIALESCAFIHGALTHKNVLVKSYREYQNISIIYASTVFKFRTKHIPVIINYHFATCAIPYQFGLFVGDPDNHPSYEINNWMQILMLASDDAEYMINIDEQVMAEPVPVLYIEAAMRLMEPGTEHRMGRFVLGDGGYYILPMVYFWRNDMIDVIRSIGSISGMVDRIINSPNSHSSVMREDWDDYFAMRYLQQDLLHSPILMEAFDDDPDTQDLIKALVEEVTQISTQKHIAAYKRAITPIICSNTWLPFYDSA